MPSRRTVLGAIACTLVTGCSGLSDDPSTEEATATATPGPVVLSPVDAAAVPETATVGVLPETFGELEAATRDTSADVTEHRWAHVLRDFDCFAFEGTTYAVVERTSGSGGYVNEYSVSEVDDSGNESTVRVADLPDSDRREAIDAIEAGEHRYDSDVGGFDPNSSVYVHNGSYYVFSLAVHGDKPAEVTYAVESTNDDRCVTLEPLSLADAQVEALDATLRADEAATVTGEVARTLSASDVAFVLRDESCYELSPVDDTES
ncbi:hypothetical protein [Haloarcula amylolytica]|uniref:Lipoprotein n=1 Tax=Haloarcula amylolytica JCM 13557 TaxID=1227452 RepID=M0KUY1_9EURY|nr:hypothetical protein [Haloarcula amylolytica]EMA24009.1 hypothetical protein C442_03764 [Haloarcula amylolytica JCM 13557]